MYMHIMYIYIPNIHIIISSPIHTRRAPPGCITPKLIPTYLYQYVHA
jgi:hypothetical protein